MIRCWIIIYGISVSAASLKCTPKPSWPTTSSVSRETQSTHNKASCRWMMWPIIAFQVWARWPSFPRTREVRNYALRWHSRATNSTGNVMMPRKHTTINVWQRLDPRRKISSMGWFCWSWHKLIWSNTDTRRVSCEWYIPLNFSSSSWWSHKSNSQS